MPRAFPDYPRERDAERTPGFVADGARDLRDATVAVCEEIARDMDAPAREVFERRDDAIPVLNFSAKQACERPAVFARSLSDQLRA